MKIRLRYVVSTGLIAGTLAVTPVALAVSSTADSHAAATSTSTTTTTDTTTDATATCDFKPIEKEVENATMGDWLVKVKGQCKVSLTLAQTARLKLRCVAAQGLISKLRTRFGNSVTTRTQAYQEIQKILTDLDTKLKAKAIDTTALDTEIGILNTKIGTYTTDLAAYKQALTNLGSVDCKADPTGFTAALEVARSAHDTLVSDATAVKTYLVNTIKPTLQSIRQTLAQSETSTSTNSVDTSTTNTTNTSGSN